MVRQLIFLLARPVEATFQKPLDGMGVKEKIHPMYSLKSSHGAQIHSFFVSASKIPLIRVC
jgi:hypothetical protein